ncbi:MAG: NAD-dependent epimerase/dehydratase family protein [Zoogloeaceae bacterium]|jgi:UDP-glucose 4-epimerase|nr:NAD-dependent epimerase/dehydratase family protein [Zoogloeaceae bacterium]
MRFLVTGASGFIGGHLCRYLLDAGHVVRVIAPPDAEQAPGRSTPGRLECASPPDAPTKPDAWREACQAVDVVFHLAGRAHRGDSRQPEALAAYRRANVDLVAAVAGAAHAAGVGRFVFASSVTVYGEASPPGAAWREDSPLAPSPQDFYTRSKQEAEALLHTPPFRALAPVIVRLPLVYGPGVKGNMRALLRLVDSGLPLPLAGIENQRSLVGIDNLAHFLTLAAACPQAAGATLLVSDREDVSTPALIRAIAQGLGKQARLFRATGLLRLANGLPWVQKRYRKLAGDFRIDPSRSCDLLHWRPETRFGTGVARMCAEYRRQSSCESNGSSTS